MNIAAAKPYKGIALEGWIAKWYAANTRRDLPEFQALAKRIAEGLPTGSSFLEVAPGPGYLATEIAKNRTFQVSGLDISRSFVKIARANAEKAGVTVDFRHGNAAAMRLESGIFDRVACRAAFKNFTEPVRALQEMHRVLKPGGKAVIVDLRSDAPPELIDRYVESMHLGFLSALVTRWTFRDLTKRAYTKDQLEQMIAETDFRNVHIAAEGIGLEVWLEK